MFPALDIDRTGLKSRFDDRRRYRIGYPDRPKTRAISRIEIRYLT
jgi:hypothetical protein